MKEINEEKTELQTAPAAEAKPAGPADGTKSLPKKKPAAKAPADAATPVPKKKPAPPKPPQTKEIALSIRDVEIAYRTARSFSLKNLSKTLRRNPDAGKKFYAVKGVSFDVYKGEIIGMIGKNGSGKSTLLRAVANIYSPDVGYIDTFDHTVALMAIGVGFINTLTGRENIYLSGLLMGFTKKQIDEKVDEIIEFAGIGKFIDEPVRNYSSGMHSKLAFSITAIMEADIMLVDETLSVGDSRFKVKSLRKMKQLIRDEDKTILLVSHSISVLRELCHRIIWLDDGKIRMIGDTETVLNAYEEYVNSGD